MPAGGATCPKAAEHAVGDAAIKDALPIWSTASHVRLNCAFGQGGSLGVRVSVYTAENGASEAPLVGVRDSDGVAAETPVSEIAPIATAIASAAQNRTRVFIALLLRPIARPSGRDRHVDSRRR